MQSAMSFLNADVLSLTGWFYRGYAERLTMNDKIRVLIADDHAIVREGLRLLLERAPDIEVVAEAENGRVAVQETVRLQPDVVLLDIEMPLLNGVEAATRIREEAPATKVV